MLFLPPSLPQSIQGKRKTREVIQVPSATNKGVLSFPLNRALAFNHRIHFQNEGPAFTANWSTITLLPALWLLFSSWIYKMSWVKTAAFRPDNDSSCKSLLVTWQKKACIWWTATNGNSTHWKAEPSLHQQLKLHPQPGHNPRHPEVSMVSLRSHRDKLYWREWVKYKITASSSLPELNYRILFQKPFLSQLVQTDQ